jgi:hypothetical protein
MPRVTPATSIHPANGTHPARPRGNMVLRLRELLAEAARALVHELKPGYPAEVVVIVHLHPDREPACRLEFPSESS